MFFYNFIQGMCEALAAHFCAGAGSTSIALASTRAPPRRPPPPCSPTPAARASRSCTARPAAWRPQHPPSTPLPLLPLLPRPLPGHGLAPPEQLRRAQALQHQQQQQQLLTGEPRRTWPVCRCLPALPPHAATRYWRVGRVQVVVEAAVALRMPTAPSPVRPGPPSAPCCRSPAPCWRRQVGRGSGVHIGATCVIHDDT